MMMPHSCGVILPKKGCESRLTADSPLQIFSNALMKFCFSESNSLLSVILISGAVGEFFPKGAGPVNFFLKRRPMKRSGLGFTSISPTGICMARAQCASICEAFIFPQSGCVLWLSFSSRWRISFCFSWLKMEFMGGVYIGCVARTEVRG